MKFLRLSIFFIILGLFVFFVPRILPVRAATMLLNPPFATIKQGDNLKVDVVVNGQGELVDGVDAVLNYDTGNLSLNSIKEGPFFSKYPLKSNNNGQIKITALASQEGVKINGNIVIASLDFQIINTGQASINFVFQQGATNDSNVTAHGSATDVLTVANGGSYNVTATPEAIQKAAAKKSIAPPSPLLLFLIILIISGFATWYYLKHRKPPKEDVFVPEPFPLDKPPKLE